MPSMHQKACGIPNFNSNSEAIFLISFSERGECRSFGPRIALLLHKLQRYFWILCIDGFQMYLRSSRVSWYLLDNKVQLPAFSQLTRIYNLDSLVWGQTMVLLRLRFQKNILLTSENVFSTRCLGDLLF